jgi:ATP10 protein
MIMKAQLFQLVFVAVASPGTGLQVGDAFPALTAQTVSGTRLELPGAAAGRLQILLFSFSKAGGLDSRLWNERLAKDSRKFPEVSKFSVILLESVSKLIRGVAVSAIKSKMPPETWKTTALLFKNESLWKDRLTVSTDSHCYVVLLDNAARICWMSKGPFTEKEYAGLQQELSRMIAASNRAEGSLCNKGDKGTHSAAMRGSSDIFAQPFQLAAGDPGPSLACKIGTRTRAVRSGQFRMIERALP